MVRLVLRRNRVRLIVWVVALVGMYQYIVSYYRTVFPNQQSLDDFAALSNTPGIKALTGLSSAASTMGGAVWTKGWMTVVLALAIGAVFLITRSGRADEEAGRTELLRSRALGVHAYSTASWLVTGALCVAVGILLAVVSIGGSLDPAGTGVAGSLILGASVAGIGLVGVGVGAVVGQVSSTSRGANSLGSTVLIALYVLRMIGDMGNGALSWLSPVGWGQQMQPYGGNRWWPLLLLLALTAVLLVAATQLEARRDFGAGLVPQRPGRAGAPARYATPLGLALRLQRNPIIGWTVAIVLGGALMGSVVQAMTDLLADAGPGAENLLRGTGVAALLALLVSMMALITVIFALQTTLSLRSDEASGIIEPQLAGALSRWRWTLERLAIPVVWSAVLLTLGGFLIGEVYGASLHDSSQGGRLALAALAYWPAVMVFVGLAVLLWGYFPRLAIPITWGVMAAMWFITMFGEVFRLPPWFLDLLPLSATPYAPLEPLTWAPLAIMTIVAVALTWIGTNRFAQRDIAPA
ncbi:ABC transporter permease [Nakamurella sp.]|uniref:ABC transporter permease n=1 Tax=Nakamurella sp. TaxID=1869182 RepID=UPI003783305C